MSSFFFEVEEEEEEEEQEQEGEGEDSDPFSFFDQGHARFRSQDDDRGIGEAVGRQVEASGEIVPPHGRRRGTGTKPPEDGIGTGRRSELIEQDKVAPPEKTSLLDALEGSAEDTKEERFMQFDVSLPAGPLGITWATEDWEGKVASVRSLQDGSAEKSGEIECGLELIAIDGRSVVGQSFHETVKQVKEAEASAMVLRFLDPRRPLGSDSVSEHDLALDHAMRAIRRSKLGFYEPLKGDELQQFFVERYRGNHMTSFHLHRQQDSEFVLAASCKAGYTGTFVFHTLQDMTWDAKFSSLSTDPNSHVYLGQQIKNFSGTNFVMHDYRVRNGTEKDRPLHELCAVTYDVNVSGRVPNSLTAYIPRWEDKFVDMPQESTIMERVARTSSERSETNRTILDSLTRKRQQKYAAVEVVEQADILVLKTMSPEWSEELQAWTLNFNGRVKMPSKKNFILSVDPENDSLAHEFGAKTVILRFGKVTKDRFALDCRNPLSPMQALAIALTSFAKKLIVT